MSRWTDGVALAVVAIGMAVSAAAILLAYLNWTTPWDYGSGSRPMAASFHVLLLTYPVVGALLVWRLPGNPVGCLFSASGLCVLMLLAAEEVFVYTHLTRPELGGDAWAAFGQALMFFPTLLPVSLLLLYFPDGRLLSTRWRPVAGFVVLGAGLATLTAALASELCLIVADNPDISCQPNPVAVPEALRGVVDPLADLGWLMMPLAILVSAVAVFVRFRRADHQQRQQLKWLVSAGALVAVTVVANVVVRIGPAEASRLYELTDVALGLAVTSIPLAAAVAVLRHRLYDIDLIINRTLVYGLLTAVTVATYVALVLALGWLARALTGQGSSELAVAATTLVVAALFQPARRRIQSTVDRRFYRSRYDAARTLEAFQARLRDQTDLESLSDEMVAVVRDTVQPVQAAVWLRKPEVSR